MSLIKTIVQILLVATGVYSWPKDDLEVIDGITIDGINVEYPWKKVNLYDNNIIDDDSTYYDNIPNLENMKRSEPMLQRNKKSFPVCTVKKILRTLNHDDYEYYPKHFHEYECVEVKDIVDTYADFNDQEACFGMHIECVTLHKNLLFARKPKSATNCSLEPHEKVVKVGCNCIHHIKHHFH